LVIVWINGPFGGGKTTVARAVCDRLPAALYFDPEYVGYLLKTFVDVPTGDFQDLPLWRRLVVETAHGLVTEYGRPLAVPMALLDAGYRAEILGGLRARGVPVTQVVLEVPGPVLRARIDADTREIQARGWRHDRLELALTSLRRLDEVEDDTVIIDNGTGASPAEVASRIVELVGVMAARS
jgi:predicted kinase